VGGVARTAGIARVLWRILCLNVVVAVAKMGWGIVSGSTAMLADGIHSLTDGAGNVVGLVGIHAAGKPVDEEHPYGHQKYESLASGIIGILLLLAAWRVASQSVTTLVGYVRDGSTPTVQVTPVSFAVMLVTLAVNIAVVAYESRAARRLARDILPSDAKHTLSDVWVTLGVIASLVLVQAGIPIADPIVGLVVAVAIAVAAAQVLYGVLLTFSDAARIAPEEITAVAHAYPGVLGSHSIRTRGTGAAIQMDLSIVVDPTITVEAGHAIATGLEERLRTEFPRVQDVLVHVEPDRGRREAWVPRAPRT